MGSSHTPEALQVLREGAVQARPGLHLRARRPRVGSCPRFLQDVNICLALLAWTCALLDVNASSSASAYPSSQTLRRVGDFSPRRRSGPGEKSPTRRSVRRSWP